MSKKHYIAISTIIHDELTHSRDARVQTAIENAAYSLAEYFRRDNPRFDSPKFLDACGVKRS